MTRSTLLCSIAAFGLFVPGCTQQPAPVSPIADSHQSTLPVQHVLATTTGHRLQRARECHYPRVTFNGSGGSVDMTVSNEGGWCIISLHRGNLMPYEAVIVTTPPVHGELTTRNTDKTYLRYRPIAGYLGADHYIVDLIPGNVSFRTNVTAVP